MKENKNLSIVMVVTVISILLVFSGITYAYFSAFNNQGSTAEITVGPGKMLITYNDGTDNIVPVTDIQPSNDILVNKTFSLTGTNTATGVASSDGLNMPYKVGLKYTSTFSDGQIHYYIKATAKSANVTAEYTGTTNQTVQGNSTYTGYSHGTLQNGSNKYTEMVTGNFPASTSNQTITFNLIIQFPDTGENQDSEKGATINGKIVINYEVENMSKTITNLYNSSTKDSNGITPDGLQKDGTGAYNIKNLSTTMNKYNVSFLGNIDNNVIADTETDAYDNIRYVGASPNNFLTFNDETWRIIGIFNVYNAETKQYEKLIKIIRNDLLGNYSWDSSDESINDGFGVNEWNQADLMYELNCDGKSPVYCRDDITEGYLSYMPDKLGLWYYAENEARDSDKGEYEYNKNIKSAAIDNIATVRWNLGGTIEDALSALNIYNQERGTAHVSNPSDGVTRNDYWDGKIALMYASDYGLASTDSACRNDIGSTNCKNNNWLHNQKDQFTMSNLVEEDALGTVLDADSYGGVHYVDASMNIGVRPTLYLKSDVIIKDGKGTSANPFIIE